MTLPVAKMIEGNWYTNEIRGCAVCGMTLTEMAEVLEAELRLQQGTRWRIWLRYCPTSRKVAGSIPDVFGIFQ